MWCPEAAHRHDRDAACFSGASGLPRISGEIVAVSKLEIIVRSIGIAACWIFIPGQILVAIFHILGRRVFVFPGTPLQELEWHFFVALIFLALGLTYLSDRHVRIDIAREWMGQRACAWIETIGFFFALLPFCLIVIYVGFDYTWQAFETGERSRASLGLPYRWIVKSAVPIGFTILLLAGVVVVIKSSRILRGGDAPKTTDVHR
jgi:TRAP-type mannitol/chloroaromatic compound transport system permease small subunit